MATEETFLGDGLYASYDGFAITLRAPRENGDHVVVLEPEVYAGLQEFVKHAPDRSVPAGTGQARMLPRFG